MREWDPFKMFSTTTTISKQRGGGVGGGTRAGAGARTTTEEPVVILDRLPTGLKMRLDFRYAKAQNVRRASPYSCIVGRKGGDKEEGREREQREEGLGSGSETEPVSDISCGNSVPDLRGDKINLPWERRKRGRPTTTGDYERKKKKKRDLELVERETYIRQCEDIISAKIPPGSSGSMDRTERAMIEQMSALKQAPIRDMIAEALNVTNSIQKVTHTSKNIKGNLVGYLNQAVVVLRTVQPSPP